MNGETVRSPEQKVDPGEDTVTLDGNAVGYVALEYWMLNKPQGVVSATGGPAGSDGGVPAA